MDMQELLNGLDHLLEDRATGNWVTDNYAVVIAGVAVRQGTLYITVQANDGTTKHRVPTNARLYQLQEVTADVSARRKLPWMPGEDKWEAERHMGGLISRLVFGQEQQQIYISELEARITELETP